jgi:hypothetical protein
MNNISWMQRLISSGLFGIVLLSSPSAFADSDREDLIKLHVRQNELASQLKTLQGRVRDAKPTKWELQALQSLIEESSCLSDGKYLQSSTLNRVEFAIILDKCFAGLEKVASDKYPQRLIRNNLTTLQRLRDDSLPELVRLNSTYGIDSVISVKWKTRILSSPLWDSNISDEDMRSLRYLIYKYSSMSDYKAASYSGMPCGGDNPIEPYRPIGRTEYGRALYSIFDSINEQIYQNIDRLDKKDIPTIVKLQDAYAAELATYHGLVCALGKPNLKDYLNKEAWLGLE